MVNEEQKLKMLENLSNILKELPNSKNIGEISTKTSIPTSTIQRYLNRKDLLIELTGDEHLSEEIFQTNQIWLEQAKKAGNQTGGKNSQANYGYSKNEDGKFNGSKRKK